MLGRLSLSAIPYDVPILVGTFIGVAVVGVAVLGLITYYGKWGYLWKNWITTVDHKKLAVMYVILTLVALFRGFADAIMMRTQLMLAYAGNPGYLPPHHYDQIFSAHGTIMIFFMAMAMMQGMFNFITPLQIGARDVAFPFVNNLSFWFTTMAFMLVNVSLFIGEFSQCGWLGYPPLSEMQFSPGTGVDYYIWAIQLSGVGTLLTGINFFVTIVKLRAPGMTWMRMPIFTWTTLCSCVLIMLTFPVLTVATALLALDRYFGMHFFTNDGGGAQMLYLNLIWAWGHPEVYIVILPAFGVLSEVVPAFSGKPLFGYPAMVYASCCILLMSCLVWAHHFFTMGAGPDVNTFFGIATMAIAIPTGVKLFNWIFTIYKGHVRMSAAMWWAISFLVTFCLGGMTGVMLAMPGSDFVLHNSLFLVAHFHNTLVGGVYFAYICAFYFWAPKVLGFKFNEALGKAAAFFWFAGYWMAFGPLYIAGFEGMTRRLNHYDNPDWYVMMNIAEVGAILVALGIVCQLAGIYLAIRNRNLPGHRDVTGDPWNGRTLEWSTSSPPPEYNFAIIPRVKARDEFWHDKQNGYDTRQAGADYQPIHMPKNTAAGFCAAVSAFIMGFAAIWYIWWLAALGLLGVITTVIVRSSEKDVDYYIPAEEVARIENEHTRNLMAQAAE